MIYNTSDLIWLLPLIIWQLIWKGIALWKSGKNNQLKLFLAILLLNTAGILPMIYLKFFQKQNKKYEQNSRNEKNKR